MIVTKLMRSSAALGVAAIAVSAVTFLKTMLAARYFGVSGAMDALNVVIALPNLAGGILLGALQASVVPVLVDYYEKGRPSDARKLIIRTAWKVSMAALILGAAYWFFSSAYLHAVGSGLDAFNRSLAFQMLPWAAVVLPINGCIAVLSCLLMARERLVVLAYLPCTSSALAILFLLLGHSLGTPALVYSLTLGTLLQLMILLAIAMRLWGIRPDSLRSSSFKHPQLPATFYPLLLASSFGLTNMIVDQAFASPLGPGSVTALTYAISLNSLLSQVTIFAAATVLFPVFSKISANQRPDELRNLLRRVFEAGPMIFFPLTVAVLVMGRPLVWLLFGHGEFGISAAGLTARAWSGYAVSLVPFFWGIVLTRVYHAIQRPKVLVWAGMLGLVLNAGLDYLFAKFWGVMGIALSTSVVYVAVTAILIWRAQKDVGSILTPSVVSTAAKAFFASVVLWIEVKAIGMPADLSSISKMKLMMWVIFVSVVAAGSYLGIGVLLKMPLHLLVRRRSLGDISASESPLAIAELETSDVILK
ncbi:MAG TPA: lipid II flippase MurJ [Candidatus Acidoferrales bacterium]